MVDKGGGSLGAYEAGAYEALYGWLSKRDKEEGKQKNITFDIIAGTSIGAMNAAVLTSYIVENNTYEGSAERLIEFWKYLSKQSMVDTILGLRFGGILCIVSITPLQLEKRLEDTIQQENLPYLEYQMSFLLSYPRQIADF